MNQIKKHWPVLLSLLFLVATWCYWWLKFPALLVFREQFQMFLLTSDYFVERVVNPAGLSRYVSEFMVQFFNNVFLGAFLVAVLMLSIQLLTWNICKKVVAEKTAGNALTYYLSFIPTLLLLYFLGNENVTFTFPIAILFTLLGILGYAWLERKVFRWIYVLVLTPLLYWAVGPVVMMFPAFVAFAELRKRQWLLAAFTILYVVAIVFISTYIVKVPVSRIFLGINYSILITELLPLQIIVPILFVLVMVVSVFLPKLRIEKESWLHAIFLSALTFFMLFILPSSVEKVRYEVFEYDNLVRQGKWDEIIQKAEKKAPNSPLTVASLNLALAMKGQLTERYMQFYQNGPQGAFPHFNKNFTFSLMTSEVYFNVGLVNTAQRYAFEAMETIPDNNKSSRIIRRLAETNLINGQYEVARKYLHLLKHTLFYRNWAMQTEKLLYNEEAINNHPLYGYMRKVRLQNDFFFNESEIDVAIAQLVLQTPENIVAQQYLLLLPLLQGDKQKYDLCREIIMHAIKGDIKKDTTIINNPASEVDASTSASQVDGQTSATRKSN